jgi:hypothetical protein
MEARTYRKNARPGLELPPGLRYLRTVLPRAPPKDPLDSAQALWDRAPALAGDGAQALLDWVSRRPLALVWVALGLSLLFLLLHRHALRPVSALALGGACALLSLAGLPLLVGADSALPGAAALISAGASLGLGLAHPRLACALLGAIGGGALGALLAAQVGHIAWYFGVAPFALLGFFALLSNARALSLYLPPLAAAALLALGAVRLTSGEGALAAFPALAQPPVAGGLFLLLWVLLTGLALEREHRQKVHAARAQTKAGTDKAIKERVAQAQRAAAKQQ